MRPVDNNLKGRLALITGASGGIGSAIARSLHRRGCSLALTYCTGADRLTALVTSLQNDPASLPAPPRISVHQADMSCAPDLHALMAAIAAAHGGQAGPDILVCNAGYGRRIGDVADIPLSEFDAMLAINLRSCFVLSQLALPHMRAQGWGRIVYVTSIAAHGGGINGCHYAASKAGVQGLMRNLSARHAREGVTVNDVAPAMITETGMVPGEESVKGTPGDPENIPVGRLGTPEEVAGVVEMVVGTGYLTGQTIVLSGGLK